MRLVLKIKVIAAAIFFFFWCEPVFAQDTICKIDSTRIVANVIEVGVENIRYKLLLNPDGPVYVISKKEVAEILFRNGFTDEINDYIKVNKQKFPRQLSINHFDWLFGNFTMQFENMLPSDQFSYNINLSLGLRSLGIADSISTWPVDPGYYNWDKIYSIGLGFYYYTGSNRNILRYYVGPAFDYGVCYQWDFEYNYSGPPSYTTTLIRYRKYKGYFSSLIVQNGLALYPSKRIVISMSFGVGVYRYVRFQNTTVTGDVRAGLTTGFKF